jgi:predicted ester cyclase
LVRRVYDEIWNAGDLAVADELFERPAGVKQYNVGFRAGAPDVVHTVEEIILEGELAAVIWTARGTHTGDLFGIPATGGPFTCEGITLFRLRGGRIVEHKTIWERADFLEQLGLIPKIRKADGSRI